MNPDGIGCDVVECFEYRFNAQGIFFDYFDQKIVMTSLGEFLHRKKKHSNTQPPPSSNENSRDKVNHWIYIYIYLYLYINNHTATCFAHWHHKLYDDLNIIIVGKFYFTFQKYMFANLESHHSSLQRNYELPAAFQLRLLLHNSNFMFLVNAMKIR